MKRGTPIHPKTDALAEALSCGRAQVVGHLEMLWHFTASYAPQGNVGKWDDARIATACAWDGDVALFVRALVQTGWMDLCPTHRLLIHDWKDHADEATKKRLARSDLAIIPCPDVSRQRRTTSRQRRDTSPLARGTGTGKAQALAPAQAEAPAVATPADVDATFDAFWRAYPRRQKRLDAEKAWRTLAPNPPLAALIVADVQARCREDPQWQRDGGQYIPLPATYLRARQWEDERIVATRKRTGFDEFEARMAARDAAAGGGT